MTSQDNDDGGEEGKASIGKGRKGGSEPFQIHHKKCLVLHLMSRSMGRFDVHVARSVQKWLHELFKAAPLQTNRAIFICHCGFSKGTLAVDAPHTELALG